MKRNLLTTLATGILLFGVTISNATQNPKRDLRVEAGFGFRNQTPLVIEAGIGYKSIVFRAQGMGVHNGPNNFWCGARGSLLWTFFRELPFNFDVGIGGGYEYAQAPNKMHQAVNNANEGRFLIPYNYKEELDVSLEIWANLYGFYTQIGVPAYQFRDHDVSSVLWGAGYIVHF